MIGFKTKFAPTLNLSKLQLKPALFGGSKAPQVVWLPQKKPMVGAEDKQIALPGKSFVLPKERLLTPPKVNNPQKLEKLKTRWTRTIMLRIPVACPLGTSAATETVVSVAITISILMRVSCPQKVPLGSNPRSGFLLNSVNSWNLNPVLPLRPIKGPVTGLKPPPALLRGMFKLSNSSLPGVESLENSLTHTRMFLYPMTLNGIAPCAI